ncbi:MAG: UDP-glucose 4-epimerase GalE [Rhizomicrobium sp.]|jgi:UDP-glucose 4-epimerase
MAVLVTGSAGYTGSHVTYALIDRGERVVALDDLSTGVRSLVSNDAVFIRGDAGDQSLIRQIVREHGIDIVFHLAGSVVAPESVAHPLLYYRNNTAVSQSLIEACLTEGVNQFIFSSSAAVYGLPTSGAATESSPTNPLTPYGRSKLMTEWMLQDVANANAAFRYVTLRYFNVAGADPLGRTGQSTPNSGHLIKRACQVALGRLPHLDIFGTNYLTPDGTGIRDFIHVSDLVEIHLLALDALRSGVQSISYNCGYGSGVSVRQIVECVEGIVGASLPTRECPGRAGDPPVLISDSTRLRAGLNWRPLHQDLHLIVSSALHWERQLAK